MAAGLLGLGNASTPLGILVMKEFAKDRPNGYTAVSYTHLDVYKRQTDCYAIISEIFKHIFFQYPLN